MGSTMGRRGIVWKTPDITADGLKLFACVTMLIQSIGIIVVEKGMIHLDQYTQETLNQALSQDSHLMFLAGAGSVLQLIGGMALPIFAFLLVEGYRNTSSRRNYLLRMLVFALVSEIPYDWAVNQKLWDFSGQNALVTMTICLLMLYFLDMARKQAGFLGKVLTAMIVAAAVFWAALFRAEYGLCMVLLTAVFDLLYTKNVWKTVLGALISLLYVTGPLSFYGIWCYNGKREDRFPKYTYYVFYPLHLVVLGFIAKFLI